MAVGEGGGGRIVKSKHQYVGLEDALLSICMNPVLAEKIFAPPKCPTRLVRNPATSSITPVKIFHPSLLNN